MDTPVTKTGLDSVVAEFEQYLWNEAALEAVIDADFQDDTCDCDCERCCETGFGGQWYLERQGRLERAEFNTELSAALLEQEVRRKQHLARRIARRVKRSS